MDSATSISLKIAEHWEAAHRFLGEGYEARVSPFREMLRESVDQGHELMTAALALCKAATETGNHVAIVYTSAAVYDLLAEEVEQSHQPGARP